VNVRHSVAAAVFTLASTAPFEARAADYTDPLDGFYAHIDPPGFVACVTYPVDRWDKIDCDGLNQDFEATQRKQLDHDAVLIGSAVHRAETWGFRVKIVRLPWDAAPMTTAEDTRYVERARAFTVAKAKKEKTSIGARGVQAQMGTIGEYRAARIAYDTTGEAPASVVEFDIFGARAIYAIELVGARDHAEELAEIAEHAAQSVRVQPAPRRSALFGTAAMIGLGAIAVLGTLWLVTTLAGTRRKSRASAVPWPSTRG
jgi:hypothetical protein